MPATNVDRVIAGKPLTSAGGILAGPRGTALPTDSSTPLNAALKPLGLVSDEGVTETPTRETDKIKAWGGATVKVIQSEYGVTYQFTLIEATGAEALKLVFGETNVQIDPATETAGTKTSVKLNKKELPHVTLVFEMADGNATERIVVPDAQVSEVGEITYSDSAVKGYQVTVESFEDASGNNAYHYSDDGVFAA